MRIPTLSYNTDTVIYMYYGNNCISASQENITGVWNTNYKGVWHLKETPTVDSYAYDSTTNNNDGTFEVSMTSGDQVAGRIDGSLDFDAVDDYIQTPSSELKTENNFTVSGWFKTNSLTYAHHILWQGESTANGWGAEDEMHIAIGEYTTSGLANRLSFFLGNNGPDATSDVISFGVDFTDTTNWNYVAVTVTNLNTSPSAEMFLNGGSVATDTGTTAATTRTTWDTALRFGRPGSASRLWSGLLDEVRISNTVLTADWIQTEYNNQSAPSSFYNEGIEESAGTVSLGNHTAGQETDNFDNQTSITGVELFAFKLTNTTDSTVTVKNVQFQLSSVTGIAEGDFSNLYIYVDADNDGTKDAGETTTVGGAGNVNAGVTDITFSDNFTISASTAVNFILIGDVSNLVDYDTVTINLNPTDVTITAGNVGGSAPTSATHTAEGQCTFSYRRQITIQSSQVSGTADLTDFPVVISLSGTWLRTSTADPTNGHVENANGYDIIFRAADGKNQLDHEIEDYDGSATGGTLVAWVRIPTLDYNDDTVIYMLYGNACIDTSTENVTGVWDSNFKAVWHLKEDPSGTPPQINDSTSTNSDGSTGGSMIPGNQVAGKLNGSVDFDGTDDYVTMPNTGFNTSAGTVGGWINIDAFPASTCVYMFSHCLDSPTSDRAYIQLWNDNTWGTGMGDTFDLVRGSALNIDTWYYLVITWDGTNVRGYLNGNLNFGPTSYTGLTTVRDIYVMAWNTPAQWADGTLDELRLSSTNRSADWIKTEYNNQNDPSTFYIIGGEETPVPSAVDLISFTATGKDENVIVEWETAQEVDNLGFNLYRSTELGGTYSKLNRRLIPGLLSSVTGQAYSYVDKDVTPSALYYYMLEDVDLNGTRTMHGPICVDWDGDGQPDDYIIDPDDDTDTGEEDPEISIPDTEFEEIELDVSGWAPSNIGAYASWVKISSFKAYEQEDGVALEWETSYEIDNLGFHIYRELDGKFYRITPDIVPGSVFTVGESVELPAGQSYEYWDALTEQTGREFYWLDSIELNGGRASFGPIEPEISDKPILKRRQARYKSLADYQVSKARAAKRIKALREELNAAPIREQKSRAIFYEIVPDSTPSEPRLPPSEEQWALSAQPGMKIYVKEDGWYRVGEPELVAAGLRPGIDPRYMQLYADGVEQSILVTGDDDGRFDPSDAVEFYGTALDTPFTDAHVYWLVVGSRPGRRLDTPFTDIRIGPDKRMRIPRGLRGRGGTLSFPYTVELKERTFYFVALKSGERDNFFGSVISTEPVDQLLTLPHHAPSSPRGAMLEVGLQGATDVYHQVRILLNYTDAYDVGFIGQLGGRVEIPISQGSLLEGDNVVTLTAQGGSMDISLVDHLRITYWRTYTADDDALEFKANGGEWLSIGGFSTPDIQVIDITDPLRMLNVRGKVNQDGSDYAVTIKVPYGGARTLLAFTEEKIKQPAGITANIASSWHELGQGADVVIIGHSDLLENVRPLMELREQQGMSVVLVDVEDLYDEFNFGAKSPWAIKDFLARAFQYWTPQPRYLILVGDTSYDPRNYLGYGEFDLMPTKFVDTEKLKTASDDWFVDFDDDELPEMAVGRLPAASAAEATAVVSKILDYEGYASLMNEVLFVADQNDFHNFEQASAKVAELIPGSLSVNEIFRGRSAAARTDLLNLINQGQLLVNYFGHGSTQIWNGNLLTYTDALNLTNSPNLPFFVSTTCLNGFFQDPYSESLAEGLLKAPLGGAVAVWTSSGLTDPEDQVPLNEELIQLLFNGQGLTIGEAVKRAKQAVTNSDVRRTWILFGDPTLRLK